MADTSLGISLVIKAVDQGTAVLGQISAALDKIGLSSTSAGAKADQAGKQMEGAFRGVSSHVEKTEKSVKKLEETLAGVGTVMSAVGAAILAPLALGTKAAADFQKEMLKVKAYTNFSPDTGTAQKEFEQLTDKARDVGTTTTHSAVQAAQGLTALGKAGYTAEQNLKALGPALNLAFVEGRATGDTVDDLVGILGSFQYSVEEVNRVTDVLAHTSNATTTDMAGLAEALKMSATLANTLGMNVEETTAFLGLFAQNNIKGTMAGTALKRIMAELSNPLEQARATLASMNVEIARNVDGSVNLTKTFERFAKVGMTTSQAFKLFGDLGANAALIATKNVEAIKKLNTENQNATGSLQKMVDTINSGLYPALERLGNVVLDVGIQFAGPFLSGLTTIVNAIASALKWVVDLGKQFPTLSKLIFGGVGAFGVFAFVMGTISLAAAGFSYAWRTVVDGWTKSVQAIPNLIAWIRQKTGAINVETVAIERQTAALRELSAVNQRKIGAATNPKNQGPGDVPVLTGRTGGGPSPTPVPTTGTGLKFSGGGVAGAAAVGGVLAAASGAELLDVVKWAGISAAMQLVATNAGALAGKLLALVPSWGAVTAWTGSFIGALKVAGLAIAAFAATPVGLVAGAVAAVVGAVAGGYKILSDRREGAEIQADTLKRSQEDLKRAIAEGFDPNKAMQGVSTAALTTDPYTDLITKRKAAVADFVGWNEKLTQAREKDAKSLLGGKSDETKTAEKSVALARTNLDLVQSEITKRIDQKAAVADVGKEYEKNAASAQKEVKTNEQLLEIAKNRAEIEVKLISDSVKTKESLNALEFEQAKVRINSTVQSEIQARQLIDGLTVAASNQRIALAETDYMQTRMAREKGFEEQKVVYNAMIASGEKIAEGQKGLEEINKQQTESRIADSQKLTSAVVQEMNTQLKAKDEQVKKIRDLEKQSRDEQVATSEALKGISGAYLTEYGKIQARVSDVGEKLKEATRLVPSMPERALDLFKQVRSESASLIQNIESFNDKLRSAANAGVDALRKVNAFGLQGADKYKSEIKDIELMIKRANDAVAGGRFQEAENLYKSVMSAAQGLPGSAEKTGDATKDAANIEKAKVDARGLIDVASGGLTDVIGIQKSQAEEGNKKAKETIEKAQAAIKSLIEAQIKSANDLINALNANTDALKGKLLGAQGQGEKSAAEVGAELGKEIAAASSGQGGHIGEGNWPAGTGPQAQPSSSLTPPTPFGKQPTLPAGATSLTADERSMFEGAADLIQQTDQLLAQSDAQEKEMKQRMDALKYLERKAGALDQLERRGYNPVIADTGDSTTASVKARYSDRNLSADLNAVMGRPMTGAAVDSAESTMSRWVESAGDRLSTFLQNATAQLTPMVQQAAYAGGGGGGGAFEPSQLMGGTSSQGSSSIDDRLNAFVDRLEKINLNVDLQVSDNRDTEASITRY